MTLISQGIRSRIERLDEDYFLASEGMDIEVEDNDPFRGDYFLNKTSCLNIRLKLSFYLAGSLSPCDCSSQKPTDVALPLGE